MGARVIILLVGCLPNTPEDSWYPLRSPKHANFPKWFLSSVPLQSTHYPQPPKKNKNRIKKTCRIQISSPSQFPRILKGSSTKNKKTKNSNIFQIIEVRSLYMGSLQAFQPVRYCIFFPIKKGSVFSLTSSLSLWPHWILDKSNINFWY